MNYDPKTGATKTKRRTLIRTLLKQEKVSTSALVIVAFLSEKSHELRERLQLIKQKKARWKSHEKI